MDSSPTSTIEQSGPCPSGYWPRTLARSSAISGPGCSYAPEHCPNLTEWATQYALASVEGREELCGRYKHTILVTYTPRVDPRVNLKQYVERLVGNFDSTRAIRIVHQWSFVALKLYVTQWSALLDWTLECYHDARVCSSYFHLSSLVRARMAAAVRYASAALHYILYHERYLKGGNTVVNNLPL